MQRTAKNLMLVLMTIPAFGVTHGAKIYITNQEGYGSYISAAIVKKGVPATIVVDRQEADYELTSTVDEQKESTGGKIARCLFLYCIGMAGTQKATVQLIDIKSKTVVWAYNVNKQGSGSFQSTAEAIAKHLKKYLESH